MPRLRRTIHPTLPLSPGRQRPTRLYCVLAFVLPLFFLWLAYATRTVFPFGKRHILTVDLYHQYAPFLVELREKILSFDLPFYSFAGGLGTNFYALTAYYLASPLNLILIFFPPSFLTEAVLALTLIKVGLSGFTFHHFIRKSTGRDGPLSVGFSIMYALSSYVMAYAWNIMWLDAIVLLPLVMCGLLYLVQDGRFLLYTLSLAAVIVINYYVAFFVCIFAVLYFILYLFRYYPVGQIGKRLLALLRFGFFSILAAGISAVMSYPTYLSLQLTSAAGDKFPESLSSYYQLFDYIGQHFILVEPTIRDGMPNLFATVLIFFLVPVYFFSRRIALREKILHLALIGLMILSFNLNILNFLWHGMHFPNQLPYRNSFVYIFLTLVMLYQALPSIKEYSGKQLGSFGLVSALLVLLVQKLEHQPKVGDAAIYVTLVFLVFYGVALTMDRSSGISRRTLTSVIMLVICAEMLVHVLVSIHYVDTKEYFSSREGYSSGLEVASIRQAVREIRESDEQLFTRTEIMPDKTANDAFLYNLRGLTLFASTSPKKPVKLLDELGFSSNGINSYKYDGSTILIDSLLGIEYLIQRDGVKTNERSRELIIKNEEISVYRNPYARALGYLANPEVASYHSNYGNPFENQNRLAEAISGIDSILVEVFPQAAASDQVDVTQSTPESAYFNYVKHDENAAVEAKATLPIEESGTYYLGYNNRGNKMNQCYVMINGERVDFPGNRSGMSELGYIEAGSTVEIVMSLSEKSSGDSDFELYGARLDVEKFRRMIEIIGNHELRIGEFSSSYFRGAISADRDGYLLLSMPYDPGWQAELDGSPAEIVTVSDSLMAVKLTAGDHDFAMRFIPRGFIVGGYVTLGSVLLLILLAVLSHLLRRRRVRHQAALAALPLAQDFVDRDLSPASSMPAAAPGQKAAAETGTVWYNGGSQSQQSAPEAAVKIQGGSSMFKFYHCKECGNIATLLYDGSGELICCGAPMEELVARAVDASVEKHVPEVTIDDSRLDVQVGSVLHPMDDDHYIQFIAFEQDNRLKVVTGKPGDEPKASFYTNGNPGVVYEYCNLHGLWETKV